MKTNEQVDVLMQAIPEGWRNRWCGGENGVCACLGCVQIGNRAIIAEEILGRPCHLDPERINEAKLQEYGLVYTNNKITKEEWEAWRARQS